MKRRPAPPHNALPILGIALGALMLVGGLARWTWEFTGPAARVLEVKAVAHQWWWEFDYPKLGVRVANQLHIPKGRPVRLVLSSADVLHSFWLPSMKLAVDVVPGRKTTVLLDPRSIGTLYGSCGAGCGCQTVCMRFRVLISNKLEFDNWIKQQRDVSLTPGNRTAPPCVLNHHVDADRSSTAGERLASILTDRKGTPKQASARSSAP